MEIMVEFYYRHKDASNEFSFKGFKNPNSCNSLDLNKFSRMSFGGIYKIMVNKEHSNTINRVNFHNIYPTAVITPNQKLKSNE